MKDNPKLVAAVAAVMHYLKSEEEMAMAQAGQAVGPQVATPPGSMAINTWGISGRQSIMQLRSLMQWKSFHGSRFR